ncbi:MAG: hypothetical protein FJ276_08115 [Planctomycetes bacterium]|nr:hypothetical protein [Planctomycetota bacterium]
MPKWKRLPRAAKGHKWFRDEESGRIAVAEGNTVMPDKLAKVILWLNPNKPITLDSRWSCYLVMFAPMISARTDEPKLITINVDELAYLTREHGMRLCIVGENGETMEVRPVVPRKETRPRRIGVTS